MPSGPSFHGTYVWTVFRRGETDRRSVARFAAREQGLFQEHLDLKANARGPAEQLQELGLNPAEFEWEPPDRWYACWHEQGARAIRGCTGDERAAAIAARKFLPADVDECVDKNMTSGPCATPMNPPSPHCADTVPPYPAFLRSTATRRTVLARGRRQRRRIHNRTAPQIQDSYFL